MQSHEWLPDARKVAKDLYSCGCGLPTAPNRLQPCSLCGAPICEYCLEHCDSCGKHVCYNCLGIINCKTCIAVQSEVIDLREGMSTTHERIRISQYTENAFILLDGKSYKVSNPMEIISCTNPILDKGKMIAIKGLGVLKFLNRSCRHVEDTNGRVTGYNYLIETELVKSLVISEKGEIVIV